MELEAENARLRGHREARGEQRHHAAVGSGSPYEILARALPAAELKKLFHMATFNQHPDRGGTHGAMLQVNEAWERIRAERKL
jgi:hypothetical protein